MQGAGGSGKRRERESSGGAYASRATPGRTREKYAVRVDATQSSDNIGSFKNLHRAYARTMNQTHKSPIIKGFGRSLPPDRFVPLIRRLEVHDPQNFSSWDTQFLQSSYDLYLTCSRICQVSAQKCPRPYMWRRQDSFGSYTLYQGVKLGRVWTDPPQRGATLGCRLHHFNHALTFGLGGQDYFRTNLEQRLAVAFKPRGKQFLFFGQWWWKELMGLPIDLSTGTAWYPNSQMDNSWLLLNSFTNPKLV